MQHQQPHQGGGSHQYGVQPPDMGPFSPVAASGPMPLSSRPPSTQPQQQLRTSYEELTAVSGAGVAVGYPDDYMLGIGGGGGGSGASSNRWPREETQALIRIRSEMDATFRDATLKGPLWDDVSRKLADLGYKRSAKKCKEKFENVHKYYKRTKEGRAGRQDGKSYRFFEELHAAAPQPHQLPPAATSAPPMHTYSTPAPAPPTMSSTSPLISSAAPTTTPVEVPPAQPLNLQGFSISSMSDSESEDEYDDDDMMAETGGSQRHLGKRKRGSGGGSKKMMFLFEGLMQQVVKRQEEMQRRFLETMEKRETDRTTREEVWRRHEVARLNREQEQLAQERAAAAARDAAIISFLHRIGGPAVHPPAGAVFPMPVPVPVQTMPPQATPQPKPVPLQQPPPQNQCKDTLQPDSSTPQSAPSESVTTLALVPVSEQHVDSGLVGGEGGSGSASSSRWPKTEVNALIQLRMDMDMRYQDTGPKGPLWEDISSGMRQLGYNRSSKRCKEKWENINKYYKKVKERNKKRPDDSKTCPYFHQLEIIYRKKHVVAAAPALPEQLNREIEGKNMNDDIKNNGRSDGGTPVPTSNAGDTAPPPTAAFSVDNVMKKPEDLIRELTDRLPQELTTDETDSDDYTDDGEQDEDDGKMQYMIQFQRPNPVGTNSAPVPAASATTAAPVVPTSATTSNFLAVVQ